MTRLENRKRKMTARKLQTPVKGPPVKPTLKQTFLGRAFPASTEILTVPTNGRPTVSRQTQHIMKCIAIDLIQQHGGSCTVSKIANALSLDASIKASHARKPKPRRSGLLNLLRHSMADMHDGTQRRYQLTNALNRVKTGRGALSEEVDSWEKAREWLCKEMSFDESEEEVKEVSVFEPAAPFSSSIAAIIPFQRDELDSIPTAMEKWRQISSTRLPRKIRDETGDDKGAIEREIEIVNANREKAEKLRRAVFEDLELKLLAKQKEEEAKKAASLMLRDFTEEEEEIVNKAINGRGRPNEILQRAGPDSVQRHSMQTLAPAKWLNDEVIHFFLLMLAKRDEELCRADPNKKRSHFFKSFFITKLLNEGHSDPAVDGVYEYRNVKRWSKAVPGKDIFKLDKIIFPINQSRMHWVCAVAFMQEKRIQFYDSMGAGGKHYLEQIFRYIQDEHKDKKKAPLPDIDEWRLVVCSDDTPQQGNCSDCGVFCCTFADFISMNYPLTFTQEHVDKCRKRIALSIMQGQAIV